MATIDIPATLEELDSRLGTITKRVFGLENWQQADISDDEKARVTALRAKYVELHQVHNRLREEFTKLEALNYPDFPTMEVPESMIATLDEEHDESTEAKNLFHAARAANMKVSFSPPEEK